MNEVYDLCDIHTDNVTKNIIDNRNQVFYSINNSDKRFKGIKVYFS